MFIRLFLGMSILYPRGRKALNPTMRSGCSWKSWDTRLMTPGVSMLQGRDLEWARGVASGVDPLPMPPHHNHMHLTGEQRAHPPSASQCQAWTPGPLGRNEELSQGTAPPGTLLMLGKLNT